MIKSIFDSYGTPILVVAFIVLFLLESRFQLRKRVQGRWKRVFINFMVSIPAFLLLRLLLIPAMVWLAIENQSWQIGLNYLLDAPAIVSMLITFLLLDYSNYLWHILLHKLPILWRFHLVHHCDLDLDITTAFRFHFGEMIGSVIFRGAAIVLIGASPLMVLIYEIVFEAATQFHHSNIKIPFRLEKALNFLIVTPRMHGIHHSVFKKETDSNYSIIFSFWDRIHRTVRLNVHQHEIVTGVPSYADENELTIGRLLKLPFTKIRPWSALLSRSPDKESKEGLGKLKK
ncbi:sterol desaturase family protein [Parapedobacter tibetensis]|uniref:sterol desaturase family protein n=1 Tax=Parapedobacter tibetensis TaxID=2972951 RepID=UPI00214D949D|nr:sterol desaturase family protein [Parapedobacter tibetensis]